MSVAHGRAAKRDCELRTRDSSSSFELVLTDVLPASRLDDRRANEAMGEEECLYGCNGTGEMAKGDRGVAEIMGAKTEHVVETPLTPAALLQDQA